MNIFRVVLVHPDGSTRRFARQQTTGVLAITAMAATNKVWSFALFTSADQAMTEAKKYIAGISEFLPNFPKYELVVEEIDD
jgi:hypothetical protein